MSIFQNRGRHLFRNLFAFLFVVLVGATAFGYALGWVSFAKTNDVATIEVKTGEVKEAATEATEHGQRLIERAGKVFENDEGPASHDGHQDATPATPTTDRSSDNGDT